MILIETTAPSYCSVELVRIPPDLDWKFFRVNPDKLRYWVKLIEEVIFWQLHVILVKHSLLLMNNYRIVTGLLLEWE